MIWHLQVCLTRYSIAVWKQLHPAAQSLMTPSPFQTTELHSQQSRWSGRERHSFFWEPSRTESNILQPDTSWSTLHCTRSTHQTFSCSEPCILPLPQTTRSIRTQSSLGITEQDPCGLGLAQTTSHTQRQLPV